MKEKYFALERAKNIYLSLQLVCMQHFKRRINLKMADDIFHFEK